jgi:hypothetical protein
MTKAGLAKLLPLTLAVAALIAAPAPAPALGATAPKCGKGKRGTKHRRCGSAGPQRHARHQQHKRHKRHGSRARSYWLTFTTDETETAPRNDSCPSGANCPVHQPVDNEWAVHGLVRLEPAAHGGYAGKGPLEWDIFRFHTEVDNVCGGAEKHDGVGTETGTLTVNSLTVAHAGSKHPRIALDVTIPQLIEHYTDTWPSCEGGAPAHDQDLWSTQLVDMAIVNTGLSKLGITRGYATDSGSYNGMANKLTITKFDGPGAAPRLDTVATKDITYEVKEPAHDLRVSALFAIYDHKPLTLPPLT